MGVHGGIQYGDQTVQARDAEETARVIAETLRVSNGKDYPRRFIEENIASHSARELLKAADERHIYVVCDGERIIGTGGIAGFWGSLTESILLTIFVLPGYQGKGAGRMIIETLEKDEYFLRARRVEIPSSVTAVGSAAIWDMISRTALPSPRTG